MIPLHDLLLFALAALVLVLTPGPNMMYVVSRSLLQGRRAGLLSLGGVLLGFLVHMLAASFGLLALLLAVPYAYVVLKLAGAAYLLWMAWTAVKSGRSSPFAPRALPHDPAARLIQMGFLTNLLNPKVAVFYLALLPQFIQPEHGTPLAQSLTLGLTQIMVSCLVNFSLVMTAGSVAAFLAARPSWATRQRQLMGAVLGSLAVRLAFDHGR